jgi:hypothetical protein
VLLCTRMLLCCKGIRAVPGIQPVWGTVTVCSLRLRVAVCGQERKDTDTVAHLLCFSSVCCYCCKQCESIQAYKHAGMQACRHAGMQARRHAGTQACRHAGTQTNRHAGMQTNRHAGMQACRHAGMQACRHAGALQACRHAGTQASCRHAGMQARRHAGTQGCRHAGMQAHSRKHCSAQCAVNSVSLRTRPLCAAHTRKEVRNQCSPVLSSVRCKQCADIAARCHVITTRVQARESRVTAANLSGSGSSSWT